MHVICEFMSELKISKKARIMVPLFNFKHKVDLEGFTLILPSVSVGNVPQLTVDLLITCLEFKKVATVWHPALVSSVGPDPYQVNGPEICTACELYINSDLKLAVLQLRSTINSKLATKFFSDLNTTLMEQKIKKTVILTSSFDYELQDINSHKFYFISNREISDVMKNLNVKPKTVEFNGKYLVHGSGFTVKLFEVLKDSFQCVVLIKYVSEGDNRPDAVSTLELLSKFIEGLDKFDLKNIKFPCSWSCVFGGPPPIGIY